MGIIIKNGIFYGGDSGGSGGCQIVKLTQAEYDALPNDKLSDNVIYLITDGEELTAKNLEYDGSATGLGNNVQDAIDGLNSNLGYGRIHLTWTDDYANNNAYINIGIDDVQEVMRLYYGFNSLDIINRLATLESKFSSYQPVDSQSGSYTIGSIAPDGGHSVSKVITFNPAFGTMPTVTARITTDHKYAYISVEDITQGSCVIKVTNGHSTQTYSNIGVAWSAVANA